MWITETPWPPIWIGMITAVAFFLMWMSQQRTVFLTIALVCVVACVAAFFAEQAIVTEPERVEQRVHDLADAVVRGDADAVLGFFSEASAVAAYRERVVSAVTRYDVQDDLRITDLSVELSADGNSAKSHFRANGSISQLPGGFSWSGPTRWELIWRRSNGGPWLVSAVERLHPITGEAVGFTSR